MSYRPSLRESATLAILVVATLMLALPATMAGHDHSHLMPGAAFIALLAAAFLVEGLPLHLPDRAGITLTVLPAALLWYYCGPFIATIAIGAAIAVMRGFDRQPTIAVTAAVSIVSIRAADALAGAALAVPWRPAAGYLEIVVFCAAFAAIAPLLSRLLGDTNTRPEPVSSLLMAPLAIMLVGLAGARGLVALPFFLLGLGAVLLLARSGVNMTTLRRQVTALARRNDEIAQALTVERDTIAGIVNFSGDGIFTVDRSLRIRHFNPALAALTGQREDKVVGRPAEEVLGSQHAPSVVGEALRRALRAGHAVRINSVLETAEGACELATSYSAIPGPDGRIALGVGVVRDVTAEREEARIREDYFSLVTHDLRNPLTVMIGNTDLLDKELARSLDETAPARRLVTRIEKANDHLLRLVNNLLELQRIESGHALQRPAPVALRPLAEELAGEFLAAAMERGQTLSVSGPDVCARADRTWCHEILANLLSNAIKYTPPGGAIDLRLEARGGNVAASVTDTGHGLVPEELEKLFTKFFRSKRAEIRSAGGTGLGLALAKRMAERMGGDITVRSTVGVGSAFTVLLPLGDVPPFLAQRTERNVTIEQQSMKSAEQSLSLEEQSVRSAEEPILSASLP